MGWRLAARRVTSAVIRSSPGSITISLVFPSGAATSAAIFGSACTDIVISVIDCRFILLPLYLEDGEGDGGVPVAAVGGRLEPHLLRLRSPDRPDRRRLRLPHQPPRLRLPCTPAFLSAASKEAGEPLSLTFGLFDDDSASALGLGLDFEGFGLRGEADGGGELLLPPRRLRRLDVDGLAPLHHLDLHLLRPDRLLQLGRLQLVRQLRLRLLQRPPEASLLLLSSWGGKKEGKRTRALTSSSKAACFKASSRMASATFVSTAYFVSIASRSHVASFKGTRAWNADSQLDH